MSIHALEIRGRERIACLMGFLMGSPAAQTSPFLPTIEENRSLKRMALNVATRPETPKSHERPRIQGNASGTNSKIKETHLETRLAVPGIRESLVHKIAAVGKGVILTWTAVPTSASLASLFGSQTAIGRLGPNLLRVGATLQEVSLH